MILGVQSEFAMVSHNCDLYSLNLKKSMPAKEILANSGWLV